MAYLDDKIPQAYKLSNEALKSPKFDTEAFLVASMIRLLNQQVASEDLVPESNIDEITDVSKDAFVEYMHNKTIDNLIKYLSYIKQILAELYYNSDGEHKEEISKFIDNLSDIK